MRNGESDESDVPLPFLDLPSWISSSRMYPPQETPLLGNRGIWMDRYCLSVNGLLSGLGQYHAYEGICSAGWIFFRADIYIHCFSKRGQRGSSHRRELRQQYGSDYCFSNSSGMDIHTAWQYRV